MTDLTAAEVQVLVTLADNRPMTQEELARSVADTGMFLGPAEVATSMQNLVGMGLATPAPAASLGKFTATADGRTRIHERLARSRPQPGECP
jgi:hypothetical protein